MFCFVESQQEFRVCYSISYTEIKQFVQENTKLMKEANMSTFQVLPMRYETWIQYSSWEENYPEKKKQISSTDYSTTDQPTTDIW